MGHLIDRELGIFGQGAEKVFGKVSAFEKIKARKLIVLLLLEFADLLEKIGDAFLFLGGEVVDPFRFQFVKGVVDR